MSEIVERLKNTQDTELTTARRDECEEKVRRKGSRKRTRRSGKRRCRFRLDDLPVESYVVFDGDTLIKRPKSPDCIIFVEREGLEIAVVEIKTTGDDATSIHRKLANGHGKAREMLQTYAPQARPQWRFIVLASHWVRDEYKEISRHRISAHGRQHDILISDCNLTLDQVLAQHSI